MSTQQTSRDGCGYQGYEFGSSRYPDSLCIGGLLYDADSDNFSGGGDICCPACNTRAWLRDAADDPASLDWDHPDLGWQRAVVVALGHDEAEALACLAELGSFEIEIGDDLAPAVQWPWEIPGISAHQNLRIRRAALGSG